MNHFFSPCLFCEIVFPCFTAWLSLQPCCYIQTPLFWNSIASIPETGTTVFSFGITFVLVCPSEQYWPCRYWSNWELRRLLSALPYLLILLKPYKLLPILGILPEWQMFQQLLFILLSNGCLWILKYHLHEILCAWKLYYYYCHYVYLLSLSL